MAARNPLVRLRRLSESYSLRGRRPRQRPGWYLGPHARSDATGIVIGGAARSGTTLVRVMLDSHPNLRCGPESSLFRGMFLEGHLSRQFEVPRAAIRRLESAAPSFPHFVAAFLDAYARREGGRLWAEKTPDNVFAIGWILDRFPNVTFCHVVRDGRAVVNSLRTYPKFRNERGRIVPTGIVNDLDRCIDRWLEGVTAGLDFDGHPRVVTLRYEDVVARPEQSLGPLLARVGLAWDPAMREFHTVTRSSRDPRRFPQNLEATRPLDPSATERWRSELSTEQVARIEERGGAVLARLGYR